jgi:hypothetical protein
MKEYIIGVPDDEPLSSLRRSGKTITAIAKIVGNCDEVIRCRDCKWWKAEKEECVEWYDSPYAPADGYCFRAERKEK